MAHQIFLVEDHPIVREGLASLIEPEPGLTVASETGSAKEARRRLPDVDPDLIILDLSLEEGSGLNLLEHIHASRPDLPVLVVSMHDESLYARRALDAGARGYLMKNNANAKVIEAIRHVLRGNVYLSPEMTSSLLSGHVRGDDPEDTSLLSTLSDRELEVLMLLGKGAERREIADDLTLSPKTIDTYMNNLKKKLSLETNAGLRRYAVLWVELSEDDLPESD